MVTPRSASESETTALSQQPDEKAKTPGKPRDLPDGDFKIADLGENGVVYVKLPDGRHVAATVKDGVEVKRHNKVTLTGDDDDFKNAVVTGLAS